MLFFRMLLQNGVNKLAPIVEKMNQSTEHNQTVIIDFKGFSW